MEHHFNVEIAERYGMLEAVILNNLYFWVKKNEANDMNLHDGHYWTYNSTKAFHELFPYASEHRIRNALKHLEEHGLILTGNYNKSSYDRTRWYALTKTATSILQNYKMENIKLQNGLCENGTPIPDNNPDNNSDDNIDYKMIIDILNETAGTAYRASTNKTKELIKARFSEGFNYDDFIKVIDNKAKDWKGTEWEKYLRPQTLFGTKFESYLNQRTVSNNPFADMLR